MIQTLFQLGKALQSDAKYRDYLTPYQNPFPGYSVGSRKIIYFNITGGHLEEKVHIEPFRKSYLSKYLFRNLRGNNAAPLLPVDRFSIGKTEKSRKEKAIRTANRFKRSFDNIPKLYFPSDEAKLLAIDKLEQLLQDDSIEDLISGKNDSYLLTFKLNGMWLGEVDECLMFLNNKAYDEYRDKSKSKDKTCSLSYLSDKEVWGRVDTLGFTVEKKVFVKGGFSRNDSYKMFPVSPVAVQCLEGGSSFAIDNLTRQFGNLRYWVVPRLIERNEEALIFAVERLAQSAQETLDDQSRSILNNEQLLFKIAEMRELSRAGILYDFLFFEQKQAQLAIQLYLTDIQPTRLAQIARTKQQLEAKYFRLTRLYTQKGESRFYLTFQLIRPFFSSVHNKITVYHPMFFRLIEATFYGQQVDERGILGAFVQEIQSAFKQRYESKSKYLYRTKEAFLIWHFFFQLNLFSKTHKPGEMTSQPVAATLDDFLEQHTHFFDHDHKRAAFLMGCLVEQLLQLQRKEIKNAPFVERLNGLNLDASDLRKLFPKVLDKISQYKRKLEFKYYTRIYIEQLQVRIPPLLMQTDLIKREEISFAFCCGLVMEKEFTNARIQAHQQAESTPTEA